MKRILQLSVILVLLFPSRGLSYVERGCLVPIVVQRVAFFPIDNLTGVDLPQDLRKEIVREVRLRGLKLLSGEEVDSFLLRNRIRRWSGLTTAMAKKAQEELGAEGVLVAWVDLYDEKRPAIGIGARLIETRTGLPLWANYVSLVGDDFVSFLKLGKISSLEELTKIALARLFSDFSTALQGPVDGGKPLVVKELHFLPRIVRGGQVVKARVQLEGKRGGTYRVYALLDGQEFPLKLTKGWWEGEVVAPKRQGLYLGRIKVRWDGTWIDLNSATTLLVDNTPPAVDLSFENLIFSPNGDGRKDAFIFFPSLLEEDRVKHWEFSLMDEKGKIIRKFVGSGELPLGIAWRGEGTSGEGAAEGLYHFSCSIEDEAGNVFHCPSRTVIVDKTPPAIVVNPSIEGREIKFIIEAKEEIGIEGWRFFITTRGGKVLKAEEGEGPPPSQIQWRPLGDLKDLSFSLEVCDRAGNWAEAKGTVVSTEGKGVKKKGEKPIKRKKPEWNYDF
ncbi:MAG: hypothetical protein DRG33_00055 [Deltaproteobacteria bacterium]|nr:MAG: hypothetical protein DRG33_00055 [Deltaproteobacteria bacterium]